MLLCTYSLLDVADANASGEVRVKSNDRGYREYLGAIDQGGRVVADDREYAHDELEVTLELSLVVCCIRSQKEPSQTARWMIKYSLTKLCHSQAVLSLRASCARGVRSLGQVAASVTHVVVRLETHLTPDWCRNFSLVVSSSAGTWVRGHWTRSNN